MSTQDAGPSSSLKHSSSASGIRTVLRYTGIPPSWLDKRPKLPSRNWLIFLSVTSSFTGFYIYDRQKCKRIRQEYIEKVQHLAEEPIDTMGLARKVTVYGAKWPGDDDYDQSMKYFRKYIKPIFVAAAVDYDMITGKRHGEIASRVAEDIKSRRRLDAGLDARPTHNMAIPTLKSPEEQCKNELNGGIVIIGRPTFKEFMSGLKKGWSEGLQRIDPEEELARELEDDGRFDELEPEKDTEISTDTKIQSFASPPHAAIFSPLQLHQTKTDPKPQSSSLIPDSLNAPPSTIPEQPPLLLVSFVDYIGFTQIPLMIWDFFNQRYKVQAGAEAAYCLVKQWTRPFAAPDESSKPLFSDITNPEIGSLQGDLDFDKRAESFYKKSTSSIADDIEKARKKYYDALPGKLVAARAIARGERELTKEEIENPPPTEVELRAERLRKELRWRKDLEGWDIVNPSSNVAWDERFRGALKVFIAPSEEELNDNAGTS